MVQRVFCAPCGAMEGGLHQTAAAWPCPFDQAPVALRRGPPCLRRASARKTARLPHCGTWCPPLGSRCRLQPTMLHLGASSWSGSPRSSTHVRLPNAVLGQRCAESVAKSLAHAVRGRGHPVRARRRGGSPTSSGTLRAIMWSRRSSRVGLGACQGAGTAMAAPGRHRAEPFGSGPVPRGIDASENQ